MKELLAKWGSKFGRADTQPLVDGVWRCCLGDEAYILKRRSNRTRALEEYDLLKWLSEHDQPVSLLLHTKEGVPWAEYQGSFFVLYPYLPGIPGDTLVTRSHSWASEAGSTLARLHRCLADYDAHTGFPGFDLFHEVSTYAWPVAQSYSSEKLHHRLHELGQTISEQLVNPYEALPRQLIHRDFHPGNLVFRDEEVAGILDFDRVRIGIRVFDLCYLATSVLSSTFSDLGRREEWPSFVQELIRGYAREMPLGKTEGHVFLYITYLIQLLFVAYHLDAGDTKRADVDLAILFWLYDQQEYLQPLIDKTVTEVKE